MIGNVAENSLGGDERYQQKYDCESLSDITGSTLRCSLCLWNTMCPSSTQTSPGPGM
jgi:hypothetical protein